METSTPHANSSPEHLDHPHLLRCRYGFMFGRESARRELGGIIDDLRKSNTTSIASSEPDADSKP
jgi:hypothetical protein